MCPNNYIQLYIFSPVTSATPYHPESVAEHHCMDKEYLKLNSVPEGLASVV